MNIPHLTAALLSIFINHINKHGKCNDAVICKEIAEHIHTSRVLYYGATLWEFIHDFGESEDLEYMGRDQYGEKQYHSNNPNTNWNTMVGKELEALGHYSKEHQAELLTLVTLAA